MPADSIKKIKEAELPSMIGTSGPCRSINALSIPKPAKAARICSTVMTEAFFLAIVVPSVVSVTFSARAGICWTGSRSSLLKIIPVFLAAGLRVSVTFSPECIPTPEALTIFDNVLCFNIS